MPVVIAVAAFVVMCIIDIVVTRKSTKRMAELTDLVISKVDEHIAENKRFEQWARDLDNGRISLKDEPAQVVNDVADGQPQ